MTYVEVEQLQISNIISNASELKNLVKQCLSIIPTATAKDNEIIMWINAGISDMVRQGIDVAGNIQDGLVQGTIVLFVKSHFGFVDAKDKEQAEKAYYRNVGQLSLSKQYQLEGVIEDA